MSRRVEFRGQSGKTYAFVSVEAEASLRPIGVTYVIAEQAAGVWRLPAGELYFTQAIQRLSGTLLAPGARKTSVEGRVTGDRIRFTLNSDVYTGHPQTRRALDSRI